MNVLSARITLTVLALMAWCGVSPGGIPYLPSPTSPGPGMSGGSAGVGGVPNDPDGDPGSRGGGGEPGCDKTLSDPVDFSNGGLVQSVVDFSIPGRGIDIEFRRSYRSIMGYWDYHRNVGDAAMLSYIPHNDLASPPSYRVGPIGRNWDHSYNIYIEQVSRVAVIVNTGNCRFDCMERVTSASCPTNADSSLDDLPPNSCMELHSAKGSDNHRLVITKVGSSATSPLMPVIYRPGGGKWVFSPLQERSFSPYRSSHFAGGGGGAVPAPIALLKEIHDEFGNIVRLEYDEYDRLSRIIDTHCREISFGYPANIGGQPVRQIATVTDHTGRVWTYERYTNGESGGQPGDLKSVALPAVDNTAAWPIPQSHVDAPGTVRKWRYAYQPVPPTATPAQLEFWLGEGGLASITAPGESSAFSTTSYDGPAAADPNANVVGHFRVASQNYGGYPFAYSYSGRNVTVTDRMGNVRTFSFKSPSSSQSQVYLMTGRTDSQIQSGASQSMHEPPPGYSFGLPAATASTTTAFEHDEYGRLTGVVLDSASKLKYGWEPGGADPTKRGQVTSVERVNASGTPLNGTELRSYELSSGSACGCSAMQPSTVRDRRGNWVKSTKTYEATIVPGGRDHTRTTVHLPANSGSNLTPPSVTPLSEESWDYSCSGLMLKHTHPASDTNGFRRVDVFIYDALPEPTCGSCVGQPPSRPCAENQGYLTQKIEDFGNLNLTTNYVYNDAGNVIKQTSPDGTEYHSVFDQHGNLIQSRVESPQPGGQPNKVMSRTDSWYDLRGNLVRQDTLNLGADLSVDAVNPVFTTIHEYDIINRRVRTCVESGVFDVPASQRTCAGLDTNANFVTTEFKYDGNDHVVDVRRGTKANGQLLQVVSRSLYDEMNRLFLSVSGSGTEATATRHDYDSFGRLTQVTSGFRFDDQGFDPTVGFGTNSGVAAARLSVVAGTTPARVNLYYDILDRVTVTSMPLTATSTTTTTKEYDNVGNVTKTFTIGVRPCGNLGVSTNSDNVILAGAEYEYDELRRQKAIARWNVYNPASCVPSPGGQYTTKFWTRTAYFPNGSVKQVDSEVGLTSFPNVPDLVNTTSYAYDTMNRVRFVTDTMGNKVEYRYDAVGNAIGVISHEVGGVLPGSTQSSPTQYYAYSNRYDAMGRLVRRSDHLKNVSTFGYDSRGNTLFSIDPNTGRSEWTYDALGRVTKFRRPMTSNPAGDAIEVLTAWDHLSRLQSRTDDNGNSTTYLYDTHHRPKSATMADGSASSVEYDVFGNPKKIVDANGIQVESKYDGYGRVLERTITELTPGSGVQLALNGPAKERFQYDGLSRVTLAEDNDSRVYRSYDTLGRILTEDTVLAAYETAPLHPAPDTSTVPENPDPEGGVNASTRRRVQYSYLQTSELPGAPTFEMVFGTPTSTIYPGGYGVAQFGLPVINQQREVRRSLDTLGRTTQIRVSNQNPDGTWAPAAPVATMTYAGPDRLLARDYGDVIPAAATPPPPARRFRTEFEYTPGWTYSALLNAPIEPAIPATFSGSRRVQSIEHKIADATNPSVTLQTLADIGFGWDPAQNKTNKTLIVPPVCDIALSWAYGYDRANRLVNVNHGSWKFDRTETHTLDGVHNRQSMDLGGSPVPYEMSDHSSRKDRQVNQYTRTPTERYEYDNNGNLIRTSKDCRSDLTGDSQVTTPDLVIMLATFGTTDLRGDINMDGYVTTQDLVLFLGDFGKGCAYDQYIYDYRNQMVRAETYSWGINGVGGDCDEDEIPNTLPCLVSSTRYRYDALGRRLAKETGGGSTVDRLVYGGAAGWQLLEVQRLSSSRLRSETTASFVYGDQGIDDPISLRTGTLSLSGGPTTFADYVYLLDDQSNVVALADPVGNVVERYDYTEYGSVMFLDPCLNFKENVSGAVTRSEFGNPLLFQGRFYDDETGLYEFRTRYLSPGMGRFTSRDRIGVWGDPSNLGNGLGFAASSPQVWNDSFGLKSYRKGREDPWLKRDLRPDDFGTETGDWEDDFYKFKLVNFYAPLLEDDLPDAVANLRHFLSGSGSTYNINVKALRAQSRSSDDLYEAEFAEAMAFAQTLPNGTHDITSGEASLGSTSDNTNWYLAVGGYSAWGKGTVTVDCDDITLNFEYHVYDEYNWDSGKGLGPQIFLFWGRRWFEDKDLQRLHKIGIAKEFTQTGQMSETFRWSRNRPFTPTPVSFPGYKGPRR